MPVQVNGSGGGSVTLDAGAASNATTLTLPNTTGTVLVAPGGILPVTAGGTGAATLAANNVVLGNGTSAVQVVAPGTSGNVLTSNGTTWQSTAATGSVANVQTFTSSGTWTKPSLGASSRVLIQAWGAGGSGAKSAGGGGGGGGYNERWLTLSQMGATETITIGAGGTAVTTNVSGNQGGNTTVGSWVTAYGGAGGLAGASQGGGGGGQLSAGTTTVLAGTNVVTGNIAPGAPMRGYVSNDTAVYEGGGAYNAAAGDGFMHGGGGGNGSYPVGAKSVWGGGGGGGNGGGAGGASSFGGSGGAGNTSTSGVAGTQPGGGGGGTNSGTSSGAGGAGQVIITVFPG